MKSSYITLTFRSLLAAACLTSQIPEPAVHADDPNSDSRTEGIVATETSAFRVRDVCLQKSRRLRLRLVDHSGKPQPGQVVRFVFQNRVIAESTSDAEGQVTVSGLRPGVHTVVAGASVNVYRLWTEETAPPSAVRTPAVVTDDPTVRGQYGYGPPMVGPGMLATGITIAAVVAVIAGKNSGGKSHVVPASP